jgi:DNA-binding GntR family transcriptional regulator
MADGRAPDKGSRMTATDLAHARPREAIVGARLSPNEGSIEVVLAEELGVGRAVVRTYLARLEHIGPAERVAYRGASVRAISEAEAVEILEARAVREGLVARHAPRRAMVDESADVSATLAQMQVRLQAADLRGLSELNGSLHRQILGIARHEPARRHPAAAERPPSRSNRARPGPRQGIARRARSHHRGHRSWTARRG